MANNYGDQTQENEMYYDNNQQSYQADQNFGPYYENSGYARGPQNQGFRGSRNGNRGGGFNQRRGFRPNRGGGRGSRFPINEGNYGGNGNRGNFEQRGRRRARGHYDPLPANVNWNQQLERDRKEASLNWAPSFRAANIPIPPMFFVHTRDEQAVLGQELMDLAQTAAETSTSTPQSTLGATSGLPLDMAALDMEADEIAGD